VQTVNLQAACLAICAGIHAFLENVSCDKLVASVGCHILCPFPRKARMPDYRHWWSVHPKMESEERFGAK